MDLGESELRSRKHNRKRTTENPFNSSHTGVFFSALLLFRLPSTTTIRHYSLELNLNLFGGNVCACVRALTRPSRRGCIVYGLLGIQFKE